MKIIILYFFMCVSAFATLPPFFLKGSYQALLPEFQYLSPLHGYNLLQNDVIENLIQIGDKENDSTVELTKKCFQFTAGNLAATNLDSNPVRYFTHHTLGRILSRLSLVNEEELLNPLHLEEVKKQLVDLIWMELGIRKQTAAEDLFEQYSCQGVSSSSGFQNTFSSLERLLEEFSPTHNELKKKSVESFVTLLLQAKADTYGPKAKYPPHFSEQILLALFALKANTKEDILTLFSHFPHHLKANILEGKARTQWLKDNFRPEDYQAYLPFFQSDLSPRSKLPLDPEIAAFMHKSFFLNRTLPPVISFSSASHPSLAGEKVPQNRKHPDCGETAVRNFLNFILKNEDHFDVSLLLANPKITPKPELIQFYRDHSSLVDIESDEIRDLWNDLVVSRIESPFVVYNRPKENPVCDIRGGQRNMLAVLENLLFSGNAEFKALTQPQDKWNYICNALSRPHFQLSWLLENEKDENVNLKDHDLNFHFMIGNDEAFSWTFYDRHFEIQDLTAKVSDWRTELGKVIVEELPLTANQSLMTNMGIWLNDLTPQNIDVMERRIRSPELSAARRIFFMGHPLHTVEQKKDLMQKILMNRWDQEIDLFQRILPTLPRDSYTLTNLLKLALEYDSPLAPLLIEHNLKILDSPEEKISFIRRAFNYNSFALINLVRSPHFQSLGFFITPQSFGPLFFRRRNTTVEFLQKALSGPLSEWYGPVTREDRTDSPILALAEFYTKPNDYNTEDFLGELATKIKFLVELLIQKGGTQHELNYRNHQGKTVLGIIKSYPYPLPMKQELIDFLVDKGMSE